MKTKEQIITGKVQLFEAKCKLLSVTRDMAFRQAFELDKPLEGKFGELFSLVATKWLSDWGVFSQDVIEDLGKVYKSMLDKEDLI